MLIFNAHVYLVNDYFLTAPYKFLTASLVELVEVAEGVQEHLDHPV